MRVISTFSQEALQVQKGDRSAFFNVTIQVSRVAITVGREKVKHVTGSHFLLMMTG